MLLIPLKIETPYIKWPITNIIIIVITTLFFFFYITGGVSRAILNSMVLRDWNPEGILGNLFLHAGFSHLLGNMIFLWVFGNVINSTIGNGFYPVSYFFLGICASTAHLFFNGGPAIGASGAVNGVVGMTLMIYPVSQMKCFVLLPYFYKTGTFQIKTFWMILLWLTFDIIGAATGWGNTAYWAHIGGFVSGMLIGYLLILFELIDTYEPTLVDVIMGNTLKEEISYKTQTSSFPGDTGENINNENQRYNYLDKLQDEELQEKLKLYSFNVSNNTQIINSSENGLVNNFFEKNIFSDYKGTIMDSTEITPNLRLLRSIRKDNLVTCYFVNEGDTINEVEVEVSDPVTSEIYPKESIKNRDAGTIKFSGSDPEMNLKFRLYFTDGTEQMFYKDFIFSEFERRIYQIGEL